MPRPTRSHSAFALLVVAQVGCAGARRATPFAFDRDWVVEHGVAQNTKPEAAAPAVLPQPVATSPSTHDGPALLPARESPPRPQTVRPVYRCAPEMVLVRDAVCIDRWEAVLLEVQADGSAYPWSPYASPRTAAGTVRSVSLPGLVPQAYISGEEAAAACEASGKQLCTQSVWEAACRGAIDRVYPYGDERREHICNDDGREHHPVAEVHRLLGLSRDRMWNEGMAHPLINQLDNTLRKTGELAQCTNEVGAFDMVGNLHEWIADPDGTFRGGFYMDTKINGEGCDYATTAHSASYADYSTGFRCCRDAGRADPPAR